MFCNSSFCLQNFKNLSRYKCLEKNYSLRVYRIHSVIAWKSKKLNIERNTTTHFYRNIIYFFSRFTPNQFWKMLVRKRMHTNFYRTSVLVRFGVGVFHTLPQEWTGCNNMSIYWKQSRTQIIFLHACQSENYPINRVIKSLWARFNLLVMTHDTILILSLNLHGINYISWVKNLKFLIWPSMTRASSPHMWTSMVSSNFGGQASWVSQMVSSLTYIFWMQFIPSSVICLYRIFYYSWNTFIM